MRILLAAPNRDLLLCYQKLLSQDFGETVIAFDGTQVLSLLAEGSFDLAVLDGSLPRIRYETLIRQLEREGIPVITLSDAPVSVKLLTEEPLANAFLPYPFQAEELSALIRDVLEKKASSKRIPVAGTVLDVSGFRLDAGARLSAREIDVLESLASGGVLTAGECGVSVAALDHKFRQCAVKAKIAYEAGKGFAMVTDDE